MRFLSAIAVLFIAALSVNAADDKIKVLIIDGQNNHNWKQTTPVLKKIFEDTGRFTVDVATSPPPGKKEEMAKFRPAFLLMVVNGNPMMDWTAFQFLKKKRTSSCLCSSCKRR